LSLADFRRQRTGSFRKWVRGIVRHRAVDYLRRRNRGAVAAGGTEAHDLVQGLADHGAEAEAEADAEADAEEVGGLYRRALDLVRVHFEDRTWRAFWRSAVDDQPTDVVAAELGLTPVAVRVAKARVLARLRRDVRELIS
jgi:RNA polymerase sigma-70 factor (ECF subfamily)